MKCNNNNIYPKKMSSAFVLTLKRKIISTYYSKVIRNEIPFCLTKWFAIYDTPMKMMINKIKVMDIAFDIKL